MSSSAATATPEPAGTDILVGLLSCRDAGTIGTVARAVRDGLANHFGTLAARVVLATEGSEGETAGRVREALAGSDDRFEIAPCRAGTALDMPYHGIPGKPHALQALLTRAQALDARACLILDAGVSTLTPHWIRWLAGPIFEHEVDLVSPYYDRHAYEGALTKGIVAPLVRALYGVRLRQPAAAEFACSRRMVDWLLEEDIWDREGAPVGIDLWLTTAAAAGDFRLAEASLGARVSAGRGEEALDLATTLAQVVGSLFVDLDARVEIWQRRRGSVAVPLFGEPHGGGSLEAAAVDPERLIESYRLGYRELRDLWTWILPARTIVDLGRLVNAPAAGFRLDDGLWARVVYDFALGYRLRVLARDHLLRSLVPLYLGWLASFVLQVRGLSGAAVDERLDRLGGAFEAEKSYLIAKWRWPERLRT
ncbi:MAG: hypothetical protein A3F70_02430 [Acidobacteria bacterium RIFCSPLOWO2_12_FULL_67_14]|nr:MAG: hypothetical protein A3H29_08375 [Acidobacteria bacterium RIFCSPLOWO2_02_FULL_67_21]OFW37038.1 MAG: hypothetical protein A3F70_02430 [Acidobacteria bacterium RIFCSPLOWO2_12_FULL_67_14]